MYFVCVESTFSITCFNFSCNFGAHVVDKHGTLTLGLLYEHDRILCVFLKTPILSIGCRVAREWGVEGGGGGGEEEEGLERDSPHLLHRPSRL